MPKEAVSVTFDTASYAITIYHNATFPAMPKSMVAVTTPRALKTLLIVGMVML